MTVAVVGAGAWGTAVASLIAVRAKTRLWAREPEVVDSVRATGENGLFLPGFPLPPGLDVTNDIDATLAGADVVVVAIPAQYVRVIMAAGRPSVPADAPILSLTEGGHCYLLRVRLSAKLSPPPPLSG
jgi:glycerol-3-phosphate dehydrogenase (NAD(P)+)